MKYFMLSFFTDTDFAWSKPDYKLYIYILEYQLKFLEFSVFLHFSSIFTSFSKTCIIIYHIYVVVVILLMPEYMWPFWIKFFHFFRFWAFAQQLHVEPFERVAIPSCTKNYQFLQIILHARQYDQKTAIFVL